MIRVVLTSALRVLVKNPIKKSFYGKKKFINVLTIFFIFHKSDVKTFFKQIINQCPKGTCQHFPNNNDDDDDNLPGNNN